MSTQSLIDSAKARKSDRKATAPKKVPAKRNPKPTAKKQQPSLLDFTTAMKRGKKSATVAAKKVVAEVAAAEALRIANSRNLAEWCCTDEGERTLRDAVRKNGKFALCSCASDRDDLCAEVVVVLLELKTGPVDPVAFDKFLLEIVQKVAKKTRNAKLAEKGRPMDTDVMAAVVPCEASAKAEEPSLTFAADQKSESANLRIRVQKALKLLTPQQQESLKARFFFKMNLSEMAKKEGLGLSTIRMRLYRAKKKLASILDSDARRLAA